MTIQTMRIRNNAALMLPDFREFILQFFESDKMVRKPGQALVELATQIHKDNLGLFIAHDESGFTGAMLCQLSATAFNPGCVVIHLYCKRGGAETRNGLLAMMCEFAIEGGYNEIIAIDTNNKPMGFAKVFGAVGKPVKLGSVFRFDLEEGLL